MVSPRQKLSQSFGPLPKHNDVVDATLLHALQQGAADFLVTEDQGLHERARRLRARVRATYTFSVADAASLLKSKLRAS